MNWLKPAKLLPLASMRKPKLDNRLEAVLQLINAKIHADIGCDHAKLPIRIIQENRAQHCIAIELNSGPLHLAQQSVARSDLCEQIDVREGNGFAPLAIDEVDSASICGMGAHTIRDILQTAGQKCPSVLILQPNDSPRLIRLWAAKNSYHLTTEQMIPGYWSYPILRLKQQKGPDPVYTNLPEAAALRFGPHLMKEAHPLLIQRVQEDLKRLEPVAMPGRPVFQEWLEVKEALKYWNLPEESQ